MGGYCGRGRDEVGLSRRRVALRKVDLDIDAGGLAELGLGEPGE